MGREVSLFLCAVQFLTRIPVPELKGFQADWVSRSARYFPLVGQLVGAISAGVFWGTSLIWLAPVAAILALAAGVLITGAFHEDGLADTFDGLGGGLTPEKRLTIMKDSRIGTYGAYAIGVSLILKVATLSSLSPIRGAIAILVAHSLGRALSVMAMKLTPYSGEVAAAKWKPVPSGMATGEIAFALVTGLWPLLLLPLPAAGLALGLGGHLALLPALAARRLIGGHTGDVLGAVEQMGEIGVLLAVAARL